jgi:signal transduction histidine kinase
MIAGSTIWFNIRKYNETQLAHLKEKMQSVYLELDRRLARENVLNWQWKSTRYDNLDQLLTRISDLFYCDINLYSIDGNLLATSRPEIFQLGLQSDKMEPHAYAKIHDEQLAFFVHKESINKLNYQSAYTPLTNYDGNLIAYINIPYFTRQKELQEDITTLTIAILNIYVLLILLTIIVAVFISDQITKPLEMLQARFRLFKLGGKYEQIGYNREDEIGRLVEEYNKMVIELERSVELLAKSERESAWREMAKQVAHEIKNPLTPMRLSVQQLQRAWDDGKEDFEHYLKRVCKTLVEQIDNLSSIASEFSNFAKMPSMKMSVTDIGEILSKAVELFHGTENVEIELQKTDKQLNVMADAEQLNRVFINIIKNGIQSIPEEKAGKIAVILYNKENTAIIEIRDNGKGIPDDVKQKMFMPNFTTKSSGMGLGLAIVQNILDQINGKITYKTRVGTGTTFIISLPLI